MTDEPLDGPTPEPPQDETPSGGAGRFVIPVVVALAALGVGTLAGAGAVGLAWQAAPAVIQTQEKVVKRDLTEAELEAACEPFVSDTLQEVTEAQAKVATLETRVAEKEQKVEELEAEMARRAQAGKRMWAELEAAKKELESLREQLAQAIEEKEAALVELEKTVRRLRETQTELEETQGKLTRAQRDVLDNRWTAFVQDAQLEICEKGRRKKMGRCREAVQAALGPEVQKKFRHCLRSGQAVPGFQEATRDMDELPSYSFYLNQDDRLVRDWFVTLCDPRLPEAEDFDQALRQIRQAEGASAAPVEGGTEEGAAAGGEARVTDLLEEPEE